MTKAGGFDGEALAQVYTWPSASADRLSYIRLNMAVNVAGASIDATGTSTGFSFAADRQLLLAIRSGADAVIVGASTVRAEGWNLPPEGLLVVLSNSGDLPWATCLHPERVRILSHSESMSDVVAILANEGHHNFLVEGGVSIARLFARESLFDDVCLTVSGRRIRSDTSVVSIGQKAELTAQEASHAFEELLAVAPDDFELVSVVPAPHPDAIFALWRRALNSPSLTTH